jgi:hypothetical protein
MAGAVVVLGVMAGGCDAIFPKKVKEEDCEKWVGHTFDVAKDEFESAIKECPADLKKQMKKGLDKGFDKEKEKTVKKCKKHVDEKYEAKEAECFMKASTLKDMKACKFKIADDGDKDDDKDPSKVFEELKKQCEKAGGKSKGDDDDDKKKGDDDDDSKKKKSKKDDDE